MNTKTQSETSLTWLSKNKLFVVSKNYGKSVILLYEIAPDGHLILLQEDVIDESEESETTEETVQESGFNDIQKSERHDPFLSYLSLSEFEEALKRIYRGEHIKYSGIYDIKYP